MLNYRKLVCSAMVLAIALSGWLLVTEVEGTDVPSLITSDTTWTLSGSPYSINGPTAVNHGATLTIEPGVTVNLNNYYLQVNGTLLAKGNDAQHITFKNGQIIITAVSNGWNQQTATGNIIECATLDQTAVYCDTAIKITRNVISEQLSAGSNSILADNKITVKRGAVAVKDYCQVTGNTITGRVTTGENTVISHNTLSSGIQTDYYDTESELSTGQYCTISDNTINGVPIQNQFDTYTYALRAGYSSTVTNNVLNGVLTGSPSQVTGNSIEGGGYATSWDMRSVSSIFAVKIDSPNCTLRSNTIKSTTYAAIWGKDVTVTSSNILGNIDASDNAVITNNVVTGNLIAGGLIQSNRILGSITLKGEKSSVLENTIEQGGIYSAAGTIEYNLITEGSGISTGSGVATIQDNTITKNTVGISVGSTPPIIRNNNIIDNTQNSIFISTGENVDASNNWWGTTNTQTIEASIHDFKNDFNLGKVNVLPILNAPNSQVTPREEVPSATPQPSLPVATPSPSVPTGSMEGLFKDFLTNIAIVLALSIIVGVIVAMVVVRAMRGSFRPKMPAPPVNFMFGLVVG